MKVFADTNFFTNLWTNLSDWAEADQLWGLCTLEGRQVWVTRLVMLEFANALQRLVYESKHGAQSLRISPEIALVAKLEMEESLKTGETIVKVMPDEKEVDEVFDLLVHRYTANHGFRTVDVLHVASALVLECDTFWSFDTRAQKLAALVGLKVNR